LNHFTTFIFLQSNFGEIEPGVSASVYEVCVAELRICGADVAASRGGAGELGKAESVCIP
jgi:hypothetical protein